ncbi:septum formation family protein [Arthrobacter gengyunqii]|uniref:Septum formation family protein n=1 Tax=Arthrobacter gengyunqii TaxID=2886940 RepID=A0A9X1S621_9MICC|nr:septum formation family protein [Arthrobacter gengyunqii]MCC3268452.1 septum formation family protein [Arthrobacter gengyunqii]UOY95845.1 septum formation family protein [Arthrobacter gengyunqii]
MSDKDSTPGTDSPPASGASPVKPPAEDPAAVTPAASGLPDLEAHAEAPQWLSGDDGHDTQVWTAAFEGAADVDGAADSRNDGSAADSAAAAEEPALTNPDDVTLEEPSLESPDISSEAAEAASLNDAAAEVKEVEAEAADAAVLTDPAANHPAAVSRTEGIAAAAPMTGNGTANDEEAPEDSSTPVGPEPAEPEETAAPAVPADSRRSRRDAESPAAAPTSGNGGSKRTLLIIGVLGVLAVLVVLFFTVVLGSEKEPGVLEENVAPIELDAGACLAGFTGVNEPATVVTCETPHNAQLVASATYPDSDEFPGTDALSERATEVCSEVRYSDVLTDSPDLDLQENKVIPTRESWDDGDRRIDCFVVSNGEADLTASLLAD